MINIQNELICLYWDIHLNINSSCLQWAIHIEYNILHCGNLNVIVILFARLCHLNCYNIYDEIFT